MTRATKCVECEAASASYVDPRDPPMEVGKCLCRECYLSAINERMDTVSDELAELQDEIDRLTPSKPISKGGAP